MNRLRGIIDPSCTCWKVWGWTDGGSVTKDCFQLVGEDERVGWGQSWGRCDKGFLTYTLSVVSSYYLNSYISSFPATPLIQKTGTTFTGVYATPNMLSHTPRQTPGTPSINAAAAAARYSSFAGGSSYPYTTPQLMTPQYGGVSTPQTNSINRTPQINPARTPSYSRTPQYPTTPRQNQSGQNWRSTPSTAQQVVNAIQQVGQRTPQGWVCSCVALVLFSKCVLGILLCDCKYLRFRLRCG